MAEKRSSRGTRAGFFGPYDLVTRQQFAKLILLTMAPRTRRSTRPHCMTPATSSTRARSSAPQASSTPYHYVAKSDTHGLTFGYPDGTFRPLGNITRQQVITMIVRAAHDTSTQPPSNWQGVLSYIDPEHGERIRIAEYNGLPTASSAAPRAGCLDGTPRQNATRGEVAQMLYNLLRILGVITQ